MDVVIWIFIAIVFIILELTTNTFILLWLAISSVVAAILNYLGFDIYMQVGVFVILSVILILSTRKFADKIAPKSSVKTTSERLIGKNAKILKKLDENNFIVNAEGEHWSAYSKDSAVNVDDDVKIVGIKGVKLIIEKTD